MRELLRMLGGNQWAQDTTSEPPMMSGITALPAPRRDTGRGPSFCRRSAGGGPGPGAGRGRRSGGGDPAPLPLIAEAPADPLRVASGASAPFSAAACERGGVRRTAGQAPRLVFLLGPCTFASGSAREMADGRSVCGRFSLAKPHFVGRFADCSSKDRSAPLYRTLRASRAFDHCCVLKAKEPIICCLVQGRIYYCPMICKIHNCPNYDVRRRS